MHTPISADNPHGPGRKGFAWEHVPRGSAAHLDFGCGDGGFLDSLRGRRVGKLVGVDVAADAVAEARRRAGDLDVRHVAAGQRLDFPDRTFTSITALDVIEHIADQPAALNELARVLADDGRLIVTVPGRHVFSFLDLGNLKFRFPRLHRWHVRRTRSAAAYERRYGAHPDGLIGDVDAGKGWHEHFSRAGLRRLLAGSGFEVLTFDGAGLFGRPISAATIALRRFGPVRRLADALRRIDARRFAAMNLFCVVVKAPAGDTIRPAIPSARHEQ